MIIMMATMGLRSRFPTLGITRRRGPKMGSVIWLTTVMALTSRGWGWPPERGTTHERITRANITMERSVNSKLTILTNSTGKPTPSSLAQLD